MLNARAGAAILLAALWAAPALAERLTLGGVPVVVWRPRESGPSPR